MARSPLLLKGVTVSITCMPDGLASHAVRVVEAVAPGFGLAGLRGGLLVVTDDGRGIAAQVVRRLVVAGVRAEVCATVPPDAYGVIHLGGLGDIESVDAALAVQRDAFHVARAVAGRFTESGGVFVTVQDTGGDFGVSGRDPDRARARRDRRPHPYRRARVDGRIGQGDRL